MDAEKIKDRAALIYAHNDCTVQSAIRSAMEIEAIVDTTIELALAEKTVTYKPYPRKAE